MTSESPTAQRGPHCVQRLVRRWLCYECAITCRHQVQHPAAGPSIVDGWQAHYVKLPSTRPRRCLDCEDMKCHGYREVSPNALAHRWRPLCDSRIA